jgi:response regulator RpfG family c-di-GMP phosphodiesterase
MASFSENTFGARIANAEAISTHLKSFTGFVAPTTDTSIASIDTLIASLKTENSGIATKKLAYSTAVDVRAKLFFKTPSSVEKLLSPITAAVKAKLGKTSKPATDIAALAVKIRGEKKKKNNTPPTEETEGKKKDPVSQSERSYGSITQHFANIIATVTALGTDYAPVNNNIKVAALTTKMATIKTANDTVTSTYGALKTSVDSRQNQYEDLSARIQRVKEAIKSQYGLKSTEYYLIKGLKV